MPAVREAVGTAGLRIVGTVMLLGGLAMVIVPRPAFTPISQTIVVPTCVVALALALLVRVPQRVRAGLASRWAGPVLAAIAAGVAGFVGEVLHYRYGWDANVVMSLARRIHAGTPLNTGDYHYLSEYPNNLPLLAIDRAAIQVGARLGLSADAVLIGGNALAAGASAWLTHRLVRRCAGPVAAALAAVLVTIFVGLCPWIAVPYTDVLGMPFTIGAVALAVLAWSNRGPRRGVAWAAAVVCAAVAYVIKTTPIVLVVAAVLVIALGLFPARGHGDEDRPRLPRHGAGLRVLRTLVVAALTVLAFLGSSAGVTTVARNATGVDLARVDTSVSAPVIWWVANGMDQMQAKAYISYGGFSRPLVNGIRGKTQPEMKAYARQFISEQWQERGVAGMAAFYANKAVWNWNDGMFTAWGEGGDAKQQPYAQNAAADAVMAFNGYTGRFYPTRASVTEGVWAAVVLLAGLGLLRAPFRRDLLMLALSVLGIGAFILVFQGRSRYLLTFAPVIIALSCGVLPWARAGLLPRTRERSVRGRAGR